MLKGLAQDHYYNRGLSARTYTEACTHIRNFEGPEFYRKNLAEWNATTLQGIIDANTDKPIYQCLQLLIDKLCKQQHGINLEFRTPLFLTNKLVMACQGVPACRIAVSNPGEDLSQLINKLQSSIVAWEKEHPVKDVTGAHSSSGRRYTWTRPNNEIATKRLIAIGHNNNSPPMAKEVATSARKRIADHGSTRTRNGQERRRPTKASSMTAQTDASTIALRNGSSNTSLSARKEVTKIQRRRQMTPLKA